MTRHTDDSGERFVEFPTPGDASRPRPVRSGIGDRRWTDPKFLLTMFLSIIGGLTFVIVMQGQLSSLVKTADRLQVQAEAFQATANMLVADQRGFATKLENTTKELDDLKEQFRTEQVYREQMRVDIARLQAKIGR